MGASQVHFVVYARDHIGFGLRLPSDTTTFRAPLFPQIGLMFK
jgi:hypothetical protein